MASSEFDISSSRSPLRDTTNISSCGSSKQNGVPGQKSHEMPESAMKDGDTTLNSSEVYNECENTDIPELSTSCIDDVYESADETLHYGDSKTETSLNLTQLAHDFENVHLSTPKTVRPGDSKPLGLLFASPAQDCSLASNESSREDDDNHSVATTLSGDLSSNSFVFERGDSVSKDLDGFVVPVSVHSLSADNSHEKTDLLNAATFFSDSKDSVVPNDSPSKEDSALDFSGSPDIHSSTRIMKIHDGSNSELVIETEDAHQVLPSDEESVAIDDLVLETKRASLLEESRSKVEEKLPVANSMSGIQGSFCSKSDEFRDAHLVLDEEPLQNSFESESSLLGNITVRENSLCTEGKSLELLSHSSSELTQNPSLPETVAPRSPGSNFSTEDQSKTSVSIVAESDSPSTAVTNSDITTAPHCDSTTQDEVAVLSCEMTRDESTCVNTVAVDQIEDSHSVSPVHTASQLNNRDNNNSDEDEEIKRSENHEKSIETQAVETSDNVLGNPLDTSEQMGKESNDDEDGTAKNREGGKLNSDEGVMDAKNNILENTNAISTMVEEPNSVESLTDYSHQVKQKNDISVEANDNPKNTVVTSNMAEPELHPETFQQQCGLEELSRAENELKENGKHDTKRPTTPDVISETRGKKTPNAMEKSYQGILETCAQQERELMSGMTGDFAESIKAEAAKLIEDVRLNGLGEELATGNDSYDDNLLSENMMLTSICAEINSEAGPITADEDFDQKEFSQNAGEGLDLEFLSKIGKGKIAPQLKRKSLYVKFDPLLEHDDSFKEPEASSNGPEEDSFNNDANETVSAVNTTSTLIQLTPAPSKEDNRGCSLRENIAKLQEKALQQERMNEQLDAEALNLKLRVEELESRKTLNLTDINAKIAEMDEEITELSRTIRTSTSENERLLARIHEHEKGISKLISENEELTVRGEQEKDGIAKARDSAYQHLHNMELCFNDVQLKFEKSKEVIQGLAENEKELKKLIEEAMSRLSIQTSANKKLKEHAFTKLEEANVEIASLQAGYSSEITRRKAVAKKAEFAMKSFQQDIHQKNKEISELTKICDDLIANA